MGSTGKRIATLACLLLGLGCSADDGNGSPMNKLTVDPSLANGAMGTGAGRDASSPMNPNAPSPMLPNGNAGANPGGGMRPGAAGMGGGMVPNMPIDMPGTAGMPAGAAGMAPNPTPMTPLQPSGPEDGDPNGPIVAPAGVPCGPNPSLFGLTSTNVMIGGRGVHVAYPCNKHKGAPMVFILNLHGTMPSEELKLYQVAYFSANTLVDSHNFITAAPKSVVSQWGNGDGGADLPHIMEVIDWVYATFKDFDIRAMWVAGHSWGAMYSTNFACSPEIADKIKGAVLQSGSGMNPACASRISVISTAAENDIGPVINQGGVPAGHGCGAEQMGMVGNNVETYWPDCDPGFTHANYFMLGKAHADYIDAEVVKRIGDLIKAARP